MLKLLVLQFFKQLILIKKLSLVISGLAIFYVFGLSSCFLVDENSLINNKTPGALKSVYTKNTRTIMLAKKYIDSRSFKLIQKSTFDQIDIVSYLNDDGTINPIIFETTTDDKVVLVASDLEKINNQFLWVCFDGVITVETEENDEVNYTNATTYSFSKVALIDLETGNIYDLTGFNLKYSLVKNNYLYCIKNRTVYRIDLNNIDIAQPLNNGSFTHIWKLSYMDNDKIITNYQVPDQYFIQPYIIDSNAIQFPVPIKSKILQLDNGIIGPNSIYYGDPSYQIKDKNGDLYGYKCDEANFSATFKVSIDEFGQTQLSEIKSYSSIIKPQTFQLDANERNINNTKRIIFKHGGYIIIEQGELSGIKMTFYDCSIIPSIIDPSIIETDQDVKDHIFHLQFIKANEFIWLEDKTLKYINVDMNDYSYNNRNLFSAENIVSTKGVKLVGDRIYFYMYTDISTVGLYYITLTNPNPVLEEFFTIPYSHIIEMDFTMEIY